MNFHKILGFLTLLVAYIESAAPVTQIIVGADVELPTQKVEVKNEDIVYQHRSIKSPFDKVLKYTIKNLDTTKPYEFHWMRGNETIKISTVKKEEASVNSKTLYATVEDKPTSEIDIELHISDSVAKPGLYTLEVTQGGETVASASIAFKSAPVLPTFSKPKRVLQGDSIRISCNVAAYPMPAKIEWFFAPVNPESDSDAIAKAYKNIAPLKITRPDDISMENEHGVEADTLKFSSLSYEDNGVYVCKATNTLGDDETAVYLNIKNRWAALWPFIGVVIEVTVLVTAILLFERHQMRSKRPKTDSKVAAEGNHNVEAADKVKDGVVDEETPLAVQNSNHLTENETEVDDLRLRAKNL